MCVGGAIERGETCLYTHLVLLGGHYDLWKREWVANSKVVVGVVG